MNTHANNELIDGRHVDMGDFLNALKGGAYRITGTIIITEDKLDFQGCTFELLTPLVDCQHGLQ